jgi:hypothetical protein
LRRECRVRVCAEDCLLVHLLLTWEVVCTLYRREPCDRTSARPLSHGAINLQRVSAQL